MQWYSLIATALGAIIAFSGSTLTEMLRNRRDERKNRVEAKLQMTVDFMLAANRAHGQASQLTRQAIDSSLLPKLAREAVGNSGLYDAREHILISAPPKVALAAEKVFASVIALRNTVMSDPREDSPAYRRAREDFEKAIWTFRQVVSEEIGSAGLDIGEMIQATALKPSTEEV